MKLIFWRAKIRPALLFNQIFKALDFCLSEQPET